MRTEESRMWPDIAIPPGQILLDELTERGMSQAEFARRMDRPLAAINEIVNGTKQITPSTAIQFERVLGIPAHIWIGLERDYRFNKARLDDILWLKKESSNLKYYPAPEMMNMGWLPTSKDKIEQTKSLLEFLGVSSLSDPKYTLNAQLRSLRQDKRNYFALLCWLRRCQLEAESIEAAQFDVHRIRNSIATIRQLSLLPPAQFIPQLQHVLSKAGVALVLVPELRKIRTSGAVFWAGSKCVLGLNLLYKSNDQFWFSLFHELRHVLSGKRRSIIVDHLYGGAKGIVDNVTDESRANRFAEESLIPRDAFNDFVSTGNFSKIAVTRFAHAIQIAPGIVVGRLQHDKVIPFTHLNGLKIRYTWDTA